jgi:hypothetical protein
LSKAGEHDHKQKGNGSMKTITKVMTMVALAVGLLGIPDILAQRDYDAKTVETIGGKVLSIEKITSAKKRGYWIDLMLQTGNGTIAVELGPAWFIDKHTPRIEANDTIAVTGSRVTLDGRPLIVAADVRKGDELLKLRDANGIPVWPRRNGE